MPVNTYTLETTAGAAASITNGDKITSIAGRATELYVVDAAPYAQGMYPRQYIVAPVNVTIERFSQINPSTLAPEYQAPVTVYGQVKTEKAQLWRPDRGAESPEAREIVYFDNANQAQEFGLIRTTTTDQFNGLVFAGLFTIKLVNQVVTGGDLDAGVPGVITPTPTTILPVWVELTDQYDYSTGARIKRGDAKVYLKQSAATRSQLESADYIEITPRGGQALRYTLWNGGEGLRQEQTYHWCVYLQRLQ